jgi:hypothetical protein
VKFFFLEPNIVRQPEALVARWTWYTDDSQIGMGFPNMHHRDLPDIELVAVDFRWKYCLCSREVGYRGGIENPLELWS